MTDVITEVGTDAEAIRAAEMQRTLTTAILAETGMATVDAAAEHATGTDEPDISDADPEVEVDPDADSEPAVEYPDQVEVPLTDDPDEDVE